MSAFHLRIRDIAAAAGSFTVVAEGENEEEPVQFLPDDSFTKLVQRLHERGPFRFQNYDDQEEACSEIGERLFNEFFVGSALERFREHRDKNARPRIALHIPSSLYHLPWEVLRDPNDPTGQFLSVQGSVVRFDADLASKKNVLFNPSTTCTLVFVLASPQNRPLGVFDPVSAESLKLVEVKPATYDNFSKCMLSDQHHGWVFFGHGEVDQKGRGQLVFVKEERRRFQKRYVSDPRDGSSIGDAIGTQKQMRVAFVLACESAWADRKLSFQNSIAGAILRRTRLSFVIGAQTPIDFLASQELLDKLLGALESGTPLDLALGEGRLGIRALSADNGSSVMRMDWWIPVMYARDDNFELRPAPDSIAVPVYPPLGDTLPPSVPIIPRGETGATKLLLAGWRVLKDLVLSERDRVDEIVRK